MASSASSSSRGCKPRRSMHGLPRWTSLRGAPRWTSLRGAPRWTSLRGAQRRGSPRARPAWIATPYGLAMTDTRGLAMTDTLDVTSRSTTLDVTSRSTTLDVTARSTATRQSTGPACMDRHALRARDDGDAGARDGGRGGLAMTDTGGALHEPPRHGGTFVIAKAEGLWRSMRGAPRWPSLRGAQRRGSPRARPAWIATPYGLAMTDTRGLAMTGTRGLAMTDTRGLAMADAGARDDGGVPA